MKRLTSITLALLMAVSLCMSPLHVHAQETVPAVQEPEVTLEEETPIEPPVVEESKKPALKAPVVRTILRLEDAKPKLTWNTVEGAARYKVLLQQKKTAPITER